jgi:hypothetical protein
MAAEAGVGSGQAAAAYPATVTAATTAAVASATLAADGRHAFVPLHAVDGARQIALRNGLGQTVTAVVDPTRVQSGLAVLTLDAGLPTAAGLNRVPVAPFAGGPAYMVEYGTDTEGTPAWPILRSGFFGRFLLRPGDRLLGIDAPAGARGGPVFDAAGQIAGVAVIGADPRDHLVSIFELEALLNRRLGAVPTAATEKSAARPIDSIYEGALRTALQVLVTR